MNRISQVALLATLLLALSSTFASAEESTVTRTDVVFQLGKAFNRAFLASPNPPRVKVDIVDRIHYANTVYAYQDIATADRDVNPSRGCFIHFNLNRAYGRGWKAGHSMAESN